VLEHLSYEERLRVGVIQPGEVKAAGRPYCSLSVLKGGLIRKLERDFLQGHVGIGQGVMTLN